MEFEDTDGYFDGPLALYRRPGSLLQEVLPPATQPVYLSVIYVAPDGMLHIMSFPFELEMLEMLGTRGTTNGPCTELFGDANIHVDLGPLKRMKGLYLGIGKDVIETYLTAGIHTSVSRLDLEHSLKCFERNVTL